MQADPADALLERIAVKAARRLQAPAERLLRRPRIRRVLHRRAVRAWQCTETPLILCHGNINRSPFAAALARGCCAKLATSAGFYPVAGRRSPAATISRAAGYGVDLWTHRSATVDSAQLQYAPAIFVFDLVNLAPIACRRVGALRRTHLLSTLCTTGATFIPDPHGQPVDVLDRVLARIWQSISAAQQSHCWR